VDSTDGDLRIGELVRRTGVSPNLLRAWEQRYGLLRPARSPGGFRLYSRADEVRIRRMTELIGQGLSAAEAARQARTAPEPPPRSPVSDIAARLRAALDSFDDQAAHAALDRLFATVSIEAALAEVLIPYLRDLGERWAAGSASVAQEHFAASLTRGRLLGLARDWGTGLGPSVLLACLPDEDHDLGLVIFGVLVARRGWRVTFLGADTPFDALADTVRTLDPALVVLHTLNPDRLDRHAADIRGLADSIPVAIPAAGGLDPDRIAATGARPLPADIIAAARELTPDYIGNP
jgi:MerR family transcriptional regulator, light-induced transcriptional regulator